MLWLECKIAAAASLIYWMLWMASEPGPFRTILIAVVCFNAMRWLMLGLSYLDGYLIAREALIKKEVQA